jgi:hypothetical protein
MYFVLNFSKENLERNGAMAIGNTWSHIRLF